MTTYFGTASKGQGTWEAKGNAEVNGQVVTLNSQADELVADNKIVPPVPCALRVEWALPSDGLPAQGTEVIFPVFNSADFLFRAERPQAGPDKYSAVLYGQPMTRTPFDPATPIFSSVTEFKQLVLTVKLDGSAEVWVEGVLLFTGASQTSTRLDVQNWKFGPLPYQPTAAPVNAPFSHSPHLSNVRFYYEAVSSVQASTLSGGELPKIGG